MKTYLLVIFIFLSIQVSISAVIVDPDCKPNTWSTDWESYIVNSLSTKDSLKSFNANPKFWVAVLKSLAKAESCLNLTERYVEHGLGKDAVTGLGNVSEGLLQLSYQDSKFHGCNFNWGIDKRLDKLSKDKTIFDPKNNLECGMIILNKQLLLKKVLFTERTPYYWAVLNKSNKRFKDFSKYLKAEGF